MTLQDEAIKAVQAIKDSPFKVTAIKLELEANLNRGNTSWDEEDCHDYLMDKLSELGLAEKKNTPIWYEHDDDGFNTYWHPKGALKYAQFYNDGSVDSEITLTLSMRKPENVLLLPKIIEIFEGFMFMIKEHGGRIELDGAGMHIALINSVSCTYPSRPTQLQVRRFDNFKRSMNPLLPALYFLAANCERTRGLEYRTPRVEFYDGDRDWGQRRNYKWAAICYNQGALEFRVFDTCYDNADSILENIIVIKNCMRYWRRVYKPSGIEADGVRFGIEHGYDLERFYNAHRHIDLLNAGLAKLKPEGVTVASTKQKRGFTVSKTKLNSKIREVKQDLARQYAEYEERFEKATKSHVEWLKMEFADSSMPASVKTSEVREYINERKHRKQSKVDFINSMTSELGTPRGEFRLGS